MSNLSNEREQISPEKVESIIEGWRTFETFGDNFRFVGEGFALLALLSPEERQKIIENLLIKDFGVRMELSESGGFGNLEFMQQMYLPKVFEQLTSTEFETLLVEQLELVKAAGQDATALVKDKANPEKLIEYNRTLETLARVLLGMNVYPLGK